MRFGVWCLQNTEEWESEKTLADMEQYFWDINESRTKIVSLIKARKEVGLLVVVTVYSSSAVFAVPSFCELTIFQLRVGDQSAVMFCSTLFSSCF